MLHFKTKTQEKQALFDPQKVFIKAHNDVLDCPANCKSCKVDNGQTKCELNGCDTRYAHKSADDKCYSESNIPSLTITE